MARCEELKMGEVYECPDCGLQVKVVAECTCDESDCCDADSEDCALTCCGRGLRKQSG
jgi:hypothetical protein